MTWVAEPERSLTIAGTKIQDDGDCYVIAELGANHQGSVETAKRQLDAAKEAGADAVKLQKRENRSSYTREFFDKPYDNENSFGPTYGLHREALEFDRAQYLELRAYAAQIGITLFATAFDQPSVDFLADLDMPAYKVASGDLTNLPLLEAVAAVGKPMMISTGGATIDDVLRAYDTVAPINSQVAVMQCTASYPSNYDELDLRVIETYRELFPTSVIGLSGHDSGIAMALVGYVLGARIVEKHFTLNRASRGTDHRFSLEPQGMRKLVRDLRRARKALGDGTKRRHPTEAEALTKWAKKLVAARSLPAGHRLTAADIAAKAPGDGLPPYELPKLVGHVLREPVPADATLTLDLLEEDPAADVMENVSAHGR